jgi:ATP-dependent DNA helicase RecG
MELTSLIDELDGVGTELTKRFAILGVKTVGDLINYFPRRYEDFSIITTISHLKPGTVTIQAQIKQAKGRYVRRGLHITEAVASDQSGSVRLVWFNQPYRAAALRSGVDYFVSGDFGLNHQHLSIMNPNIELISDFPLNTARMVPIYKETKGLRSFQIRRCIGKVINNIDKLPETMPAWLIKDENLLARKQAYKMMHFPTSTEDLALAQRRLGFEEVFELSLASLLNRQEIQSEVSLSIEFKVDIAKKFVKHLPFKLTDDQRAVIWRIYQDLNQKHPMNRLVEGDVGSGKTVVAVMGSLMVLQHGYQVAFMAPTELLAMQHAETIYQMLKPLGQSQLLTILVGSMSKDQKDKARQAISAGHAQFIVGTHALIQENVTMQKLALVIIDEQQRFGVEQRKTLMAKAGHMPHVLSLTATPIPRTLALTLYGELDISLLKEKPAGRKPVITKIISPNSLPQLYKKIDEELDQGRQMFVVCPIITDSSVNNFDSVEKIYAQFSNKDFKHRRVGLLHGKIPAADKQKVMKAFVNKKLDILVATTVIEVGVDVPNASIMLIESADRFGLAQIHQLRGRVGRGEHQGYCYLIMSSSDLPPKRMRILENSNNGFELADLDLTLRGPGALYGNLQHGALDLRIARLDDLKLIRSARDAAQRFVDKHEDLLQYKELNNKVKALRAVTNLN